MNRILMLPLLLALLPAGLLLAGPAAADGPDDILVVVNKSASIQAVSLAEVRDVFLGRRLTWSGGARVIPINAKADAAARAEFRRRVLEMTGDEESRYWQDFQVRSGKAAPQEMANTLQTVFRLGSAVSYVFRKDFKEGVAKVVLVIPAR